MELEASTEKEASMEEQASMIKVCGRLKGKVMSQVDILTDGQVGYTRLGQGLVRADQEVSHSDSVECESACQDGFLTQQRQTVDNTLEHAGSVQ